jgi:hypothetical protein
MFSLLISHSVKPEVERRRLSQSTWPLDCVLGLQALMSQARTRPSRRAASNWPAVNSAAVVQRLPLHGKVENCGRHHIGGARTALR